MERLGNEELYDVIFTGKILDGFKEATIIRYMTKISGFDSFDIVSKLQAKKPFAVKSGLVIKDAEKLVREFSRIGAVCSLSVITQKDKASLFNKVTDGLNSGIRSTKEILGRSKSKVKDTIKRPKEEDLCDVIFTGRFIDGFEKVIAIINIAETLNVDPADISIQDDELIIVKSELSRKDVESLAPELLKISGICDVHCKKNDVSLLNKVTDSLNSRLKTTKEFLGRGTDKVKDFAAESARLTKNTVSSGINIAQKYVSGSTIIEKAVALGIQNLLLIAVIVRIPINEELKLNILTFLLDDLKQKWRSL
ncbi:hypothetical protein MBAV_005526 [Candidatus Magnetobacterium bavaricum]|uniref:Uncharacterized protein n=1 Tax=Candidatus Magnetobacterium bavaricum TaxID=29290 RepID=A0A0F3GK79_9BACT|nr:hypothetical protein MBAV_005526 [Candidatus Magnetobacterium bavaricum]